MQLRQPDSIGDTSAFAQNQLRIHNYCGRALARSRRLQASCQGGMMEMPQLSGWRGAVLATLAVSADGQVATPSIANPIATLYPQMRILPQPVQRLLVTVAGRCMR